MIFFGIEPFFPGTVCRSTQTLKMPPAGATDGAEAPLAALQAAASSATSFAVDTAKRAVSLGEAQLEHYGIEVEWQRQAILALVALLAVMAVFHCCARMCCATKSP